MKSGGTKAGPKGTAAQNKKSEQIKVCIRMRPLLTPYEEESLWTIDEARKLVCTHNIDNKYLDFESSPIPGLASETNKGYNSDLTFNHVFQFDHVFGESSSTPEIYHVIARPITKAALIGYNGCVFMYGQTTSGKTYTMLGNPETPGILPCTVRDIFNFIGKDAENEYKVCISYFEIYNESINDLLMPGNSGLKVKEDPTYGTKVYGLKTQQVWTFDQAIILMNYGEEHRIYKETKSNSKSQNAHKKCSMLNLVDLAGSERLNEYETKRDTSGETGHINKSLFILANVINKLAEDKHSHIPYRDSKLTRILSNALGGNSLTAIICNISPAAVNHYQTLSTLRFASRAKIIKNKPIINELTETIDDMKQYKKQLDKLKDELTQKESDIQTYAKKQLEMQRHLNSSNNMNAKLINEIQFMKQMRQKNEVDHQEKFPGSNFEMSKDFQNLCQELKQERNKSLELFKELEDTKRKMKEWEKMQIEKQKQDSFETMIVLMENILEDMIKADRLSHQQKANWEDLVGALLNDYQDDIKLLQEKYLQQLCVLYSRSMQKIQIIDEEFMKINPKLNIYLNLVNQTQPDIESSNDEESDETNYDIKASAIRVLEDIDKRQIFDDIRIDFESIVDNIAPEDNPSRLNQMLVSYYEEINEVLQKRLDECQEIIEEYSLSTIAFLNKRK